MAAAKTQHAHLRPALDRPIPRHHQGTPERPVPSDRTAPTLPATQRAGDNRAASRIWPVYIMVDAPTRASDPVRTAPILEHEAQTSIESAMGQVRSKAPEGPKAVATGGAQRNPWM